MSHSYRAISWNRQKRLYDVVMISGIIVYLTTFVGLGAAIHPNATVETLLIRGFGTCALLLLHIVLTIGPLCRLSPGFLPLLYNRRHLGVTTFLVGLAHGVFAIIQFHALGDLNPLVSVLVSNTRYTSLADFPFQPLGLAALVILFLMAATSHDFWLANLTAPVWKGLHMLVYVAYALLIAHVTLGVLQTETGLLPAATLGLGMVVVFGLHVAAAYRERAIDSAPSPEVKDDFVAVCSVDDIPNNRALICSLSGERVAVFKYDGKISAVSNVCQHQNGPLGEGRMIDGCITCPWHGYQYLPDSGASPAPFTERVPTFRVEIRDHQILIDPRPNPPGTRVEPAHIAEAGMERSS
ncbi:MAG TPA: Rieske 2Fe-2S domain-containing protein [Blastocatellia bacterium]|nr:Rieske 2Fe-2S domain-containing protein [Blastocatellia bacterium]